MYSRFYSVTSPFTAKECFLLFDEMWWFSIAEPGVVEDAEYWYRYKKEKRRRQIEKKRTKRRFSSF